MTSPSPSKRKRQSMIGGAVVPIPDTIADDPPEETDELAYSDDEEGGTRYGDIYIPPPAKPYCSTESVGPRLVITKILNNNFKSYFGDVWLGPFFRCFHAIIGPNGSGKSNVIDSMLFVFGYRANKIRCKKLSVLIHNSARIKKEKIDVNSCKVVVHFAEIIDKPDGSFEVVPDSEFNISRTAFKDNSSFYQINDKRIHFKEVAKLLKKHNIDLNHNRFLILQGEVESIATMKPKGQTDGECGHLEYLEDIIGTERYKEPLMKINARVETLTEERTEKHNRCKLSEREMNDLKIPMENAVEYLKLENELTRAKNLQIQKYISEQNSKLIECEGERDVINEDLKVHDEKYEEFKKQRLEKEAIIKEEIANFEKLNKKQEEYEQMLANVLRKDNEIQASMEATNKRRKQFKAQLKKEEENLEKFKKIPEKNAAEIAECQKVIEKQTKLKNELEEQLHKNLESLQSQTQPLIEEKEGLETERIDLQAKVNECNEAVALAETELKMCLHNETTEKRKYESMKNSFDDSKKSLEDKQERLQAIVDNVPELKRTLVEREEEMEKCKVEETQLKAKRADVQEKISSMQAIRSNNKVLDALMAQKLSGKIPGILGRLGDLGGIDSKYDVAISTCCGRLDNIVVDNINTAQTCIEFLRSTDGGRGTFIALEKVAHLADKAARRVQYPENASRLYDLIRVEDNRVLAAFYFALGDTLVSNDLDQGTRISYGAVRYRVVTLRGEVIEISGTMSGGGSTQFRGKMGQQVKTKTSCDHNQSRSGEDLDTLRINAQEIQTQINYQQQRQSELDIEINQLKQTIKQKESEIKRMEIDLKSLREQLPRVSEQLQRQQLKMNQTKADPKMVKQLEKTIEDKRNLLQESQAAAKVLTDQVDAIDKRIADITGEKVKSVKKRITDHGKQIAKLSKNLSQLNVEITTAARDLKKTETKIANTTQEITDMEDSIRKSKSEQEIAKKDEAELEQRLIAIKEDIAAAQTGSSDIKKEIVALQKEETNGKMIRLEFEQKLGVLDKKIAELKSHMPHWRNKLKPLKLHKIPNENKENGEQLKTYTEDELNTHKLQDLQYKISVLEENLKNRTPNLNVIEEYFQKRAVYLDRVEVLTEITNKRNEMRQVFEDVKKKRYIEFMNGFSIISKKLREMYQMITLGGDAELELVDSMDPFTEGVSFSVRPPKKSWKNISNLSGGEKTLSSLALVFALHYYKPSPLYFMDEIDAALDFRNVSIVAHYIKQRTRNAQFIIISLRSNMFELADYLTGIYKVKDCTRSNTIQNCSYSTKTNSTQSIQHTSSNAFDDLRTALTQLTSTQSSTQSNDVGENNKTAETEHTSNVSIVEKSVVNEQQDQEESIVYETSIDEHIDLSDSCVGDSIAEAEPMQVDDNQIETANPSLNNSEDLFA